jgi:dihydrofolate synthase/folylpolyglutamate synthase
MRMNPSGSFKGIGDWLQWLETLSPHEIDLGLDRVKVVLERLALAQPLRVITVAGTNGKGSSVAMLEAILIANGESVGSYTSPHLHRFNERIRIDGEAASDQDIVAAFASIESLRDGVPLTYFEFGTLAALLLFDRVRPGTVILEVGLGGRLDAVNAVDPDACLITNVTLDHCDWLGDDVESIAAEKAGVMRRQTPVVFGSTIVPEAIIAEADQSGANLILLDRDYGFATSADGQWSWSGANVELDGLQRPSLEGEHQIQNAAGVLALIESLGLGAFLDAGTVNRALSSLDLPGRMQRFEQAGKNFIVDVAHNVDSARVLCEAIRSIEGIDRVYVVIGVLAGKDVAGIVTALQAAANRWIACAPDSAKPVPAEELAREIAQRSGKPCLISGSVELAVREVVTRAAGSDLIVITGSFQTVAPALRCLDDLRCAS